MNTARRYIAIAVLILLLSGCGEDVITVPPVEIPFALYGVINPRADTQAVVVFPVEARLRTRGAEPLDAVVTSTDLHSGQVRVWADSVVTDGESGYNHIFWSDFRAAYGGQYRIEVVRSDGAASSVQVNVPPLVTTEIEDSGTAFLGFGFAGGDFRVNRVLVSYRVGADPYIYSFPVDYSTRVSQGIDGWVLGIRLDEYSEWVASWWMHYAERDMKLGNSLGGLSTAKEGSARPCVPGQLCVPLLGLTVDYTIAEAAWNPPGAVVPDPFPTPTFVEYMDRYENPLFDRNLLSQPGVMSNVENGFGFVGGGYRDRVAICPSHETILTSGFLLPFHRECRPG